MTVEIDGQSGFCAGVIRAIGRAENFLDAGGRRLYSLGAIVHNEAELERLRRKGLVTLDRNDIYDIPNAKGETLLIRAHGQPPKVYEIVKSLGFSVIDCTCPVVLRLQQSIREAYDRMQALPVPGQLLIFGKQGHAEVLGLVGQVDGKAFVVENSGEVQNLMTTGLLDTSRDTEIFSQTTMSPVEYRKVCAFLRERMVAGAKLEVHDTICSQVASRHEELVEFARAHDVVVFVSGKTSSNGQVLCSLCRSANIRTYHIGGVGELQRTWFRPEDRVGVCGATSTPKWLLEQTAREIENLQ